MHGKLMALVLSLILTVPFYNGVAFGSDISFSDDVGYTEDTGGFVVGRCDLLDVKKDSKGTWLLVDQADVQESKYFLFMALAGMGIAGWCNQDTYGAIAGTAFFIGAASIKF